MEVSHEERKMLQKYYPQMECATKHGFYTAIPSTDMGVLQAIYKRHIDHKHIPRVWCSACCLNTLRGLYPFAKEVLFDKANI